MKHSNILLFFMVISLHAKPLLRDVGYNVYSQFGEDGIIEKIFDVIDTQSKVCVEFGAWDGFHLSNSAKLWAREGWKGVLIESNKRRVQELKNNVKNYNCIAIQRFVEKNGKNSLDNILKEHGITSIDLLSIDIDGNDYYILESLKTVRPRLIICEYNPTIPAELDIFAPYNNYFGCSIKSLVRVAQSKGYKLIAATYTNAFFVQKEEFFKFEAFETSLEKIQVRDAVKYLITSFDGQYVIVGNSSKKPFRIKKPYKKPLNGKNVFFENITL